MLLSFNLRPRPIDCKFLILLLLGLLKTMLCKLRILIPVLKVPYEAIIIALSDFSVISLILSLSSASTPPYTKKTCLFFALSSIICFNNMPCFSTYWNKHKELPCKSEHRLVINLFRASQDTRKSISSW